MTTPLLVQNDPWLRPHERWFVQWQQAASRKEAELTGNLSLPEFAAGHHYYGLHKNEKGWCIREWLPNATELYLIGEFNAWNDNEEYRFSRLENGQWELVLPVEKLKHLDLYALSVHWEGGSGKRIPAWAQYVVQNEETLIFNACVWEPYQSYQWKKKVKREQLDNLLIYEAHVGMAGEEECVHTYEEFRLNMLPRIKKAGYTAIQLMAIPEHPYYGSFGYHVANFFAPSSRFGTPDELKALIDDAHKMGLQIIIDLVHSHAVRNEVEGLGNYDGTRYQFFHDGARGEHPAWDSYCFNYGKNEVLHFLLSNIRYWMEEFRIDGFRFDGVTSLLYLDHGLERHFSSYNDYFSPNVDAEAVVYLKLANKLIHELNPAALSIAEDMSGMPGLAASLDDGGIGFDYRMAMGVPDYWIKLIKEQSDEKWEVGKLFHELTSYRADEKVVSYAESHDQALVGDKTIIFRLMDKEMYFSMRKDQQNMLVDRGIALHKIIRMITITCAGGAYLNFMGNEFGHPEWIDFPREGNGWSYRHARRIWSIAENKELRYHWLSDFDEAMIKLVKKNELLNTGTQLIFDNTNDQVLAFHRGAYLFVFNFNPVSSFENYGIPLKPSKYKIVLHTDEAVFGGFNRVDKKISYHTGASGKLGSQHYLNLYLPARTAVILEKQQIKKAR